MAEQSTKYGAGRGRRVRRAMTIGLLAMMATVLVLPLTGVVLHEAGIAQAVEAGDPGFKDTNPRSETWREARQAVAGTTTDKGIDRGILIDSAGQQWRELRNTTVKIAMAWVLAAVLVALALFHMIFGKARLEEETGRKVLRWPALDRIVHWWVAITFVILAITGLALIYGRNVLIPVMGKEAFAAFALAAKPIHDYTAPFFSAGLIIMLLMWLPQNFIKSHDIEWFKKGGGYLKKGEHPEAGFVNAGEKIWFWILFVAGITVIVSGFYLLFPNFDFGRETMQTAHLFHSIAGIGLTAISLGHIYLGTLGNEGTFGGMVDGYVDEGWAKQHHSLWYKEVKEGSARADTAHPPEKTLHQPT